MGCITVHVATGHDLFPLLFAVSCMQRESHTGLMQMQHCPSYFLLYCPSESSQQSALLHSLPSLSYSATMAYGDGDGYGRWVVDCGLWVVGCGYCETPLQPRLLLDTSTRTRPFKVSCSSFDLYERMGQVV
jgi:hypothetical protein